MLWWNGFPVIGPQDQARFPPKHRHHRISKVWWSIERMNRNKLGEQDQPSTRLKGRWNGCTARQDEAES